MISTDFIFRQQEDLVDNQKCQAGFLRNKILDFIKEYQSFRPMNEIFQFILIVERCTFRGCPWPIWS